MTEINFFSPMSFNGGPNASGGDWIRIIAGSSSGYSVQSATAMEINLIAAPGTTYAGYRLVFLPVTTFTPTPGAIAPMTGAVAEVLLYDVTGKLVSSITGLPAGTSFEGVARNDLLAATDVELYGSEGDDTLTGFAGGSYLEGGGGNDLLNAADGTTADLIYGGAGDDTISAGGGNDIIVIDQGADRVDGGAGTDIVDLTTRVGPTEVWLDQDAPAGGIRLANVEGVVIGAGGARVFGGAGSDFLIGGGGRDELNGGGGVDFLVGQAGDDTLRGGDGGDLLDGGSGGDLLDGGDGYDYADYSSAPGSLTVDMRLATAQQTGHGLDTLISIEGLYGSVHSDTLAGNASANFIAADDGENRVDGFEGNDIIYTGNGADTAFGGLGDDTIDDESGANYLRGDEGNDFLYGGSGFDDLNGNMGNDTVDGYLGNDWVVGGKDNDVLRGGQGDDLVYGNLGDDSCNGGDGADIVRGGQGSDSVNGGAGADYVSGDLGADIMTGGAGADIFHSFATAGLDTATDFNAAEGDRVQLDPGTTYTLRQDGADTIIDMGGGNQMTLVGVTLATLPTGWIFVS